MSDAEQISEANVRRKQAEARTLELQIRLALSRERVMAMQTAENRRQKVLVQTAVKKLVANGAIHPADHYGQFRVLEQLVSDPALCTLALAKKVFRAGRGTRQRL